MQFRPALEPDEDRAAQGRLSRIGQTHDVHVFNLVAAGTVEAAVLHLLEAKLNMFELVIGEVDMILGNLEEEREFQDIVADLWAESADTRTSRDASTSWRPAAGSQTRYFEQPAVDDQLFGNRFPPISRPCRDPGMTQHGPRPGQDFREPLSPLEQFLRDYAEVSGGMWDEVEPQVYDLMLPARDGGGEHTVVRVAFDPEAIPEHPEAQLASRGTPLVDRLLADAVEHARRVVLYVIGLNLAASGLQDRVRRGFAPPGLRSRSSPCVPCCFRRRSSGLKPRSSAIRKSRRSSRWRSTCIMAGRFDISIACSISDGWRRRLPSPWRKPGIRGWRPPIRSRDRVFRTLAALANTAIASSRTGWRVSSNASADTTAIFDPRWKSSTIEPRTEVRTRRVSRAGWKHSSARSSSALPISPEEPVASALAALNLVEIHQPKLLVETTVSDPARKPNPVVTRLEWVWDPLIESVEATACPQCHQPTYELTLTRQGGLGCPASRGSRLRAGDDNAFSSIDASSAHAVRACPRRATNSACGWKGSSGYGRTSGAGLEPAVGMGVTASSSR